MCDEYRMNGDKFRIDSNERIVKNTEIDQQWADWLAPTRRSFLFGAGAAAVGLTLGEQALRAEEPASDPPTSGPSAAFLALNGPIKPYVSADTGVSEWGYQTLKQPTVHPIDEIAYDTGFGSAPTLRHHFRRRLDTSPVAYRSHFR